MTELKPSHIISYSLSLPTVINLPFALILSGIGALSLGEMGDFFLSPMVMVLCNYTDKTGLTEALNTTINLQ